MTENEEIDLNIELYFFDPNKEKDDFLDQYKKDKDDRHKREKGYRYSPLFIIQKDIRYCLGARKVFHKYIPDSELDPANFAAVILIHSAFNNLVRRFYSGDYPRFAKNFMDIDNPEYLNALNMLRNALMHNNYGLSYNANDIKYYFLLGIGLNQLIEKVKFNTSYPSQGYSVDIRKLSSAFERGAQKFKEKLLDRNQGRLRQNFISHFDVDNWMFIHDSQ